MLHVVGGAIQFVLPASVTPSVGNPLSASLSLEAHDSITAVTSSLPSSSITTSIADNKASVDFSVVCYFNFVIIHFLHPTPNQFTYPPPPHNTNY